jgi:hypothetical protein
MTEVGVRVSSLALLRLACPRLQAHGPCYNEQRGMDQPCICARLPGTFYLDEAPAGWIEGLVEEAVGDWMSLHRCVECHRKYSIDAWDKLQFQVVARIDDLGRWEEEARGVTRRQNLLLRARGGHDAGTCAWVGCRGPSVRGVVYCLQHLWETGAQR